MTEKKFIESLALALENLFDGTWNEPVIYVDAHEWGSSNKQALHGSEKIWLNLEQDSFGELSGNHQEDAENIANNIYEQACIDISENK